MQETYIVSAINEGYVEMARNWYESLNRAGLENLVRLYSLDKGAQKKLEFYGIPNRLWLGESRQADGGLAEFRSEKWNKIMYQRLEIVCSLLKKGKRVLFSDGDIVFLENPLPFLEKYVQQHDAQIVFQSDWGGDYDTLGRLCAGFYYVIPSEKMISLFNVPREKKVNSDQYYFQEELKGDRRGQYYAKELPLEKFPNGRYWSQKKTSIHNNALIVHYNWMLGYEQKYRAMVADNLWFLRSKEREKENQTGMLMRLSWRARVLAARIFRQVAEVIAP